MLQELLSRVRSVCERYEGMWVPASLPPGLGPEPAPDDVPRAYGEFLRHADGATFGFVGEVLLHDSRSVTGLQFDPETDAWLHLPGGVHRWFHFGTVDETPLLLDREDGRVWWFADQTIVWYTADPPSRNLAPLAETFDAFLRDVVLGPGFAHLLSTLDDQERNWQDFLDRIWSPTRPVETTT